MIVGADRQGRGEERRGGSRASMDKFNELVIAA